MADNVNTGKKSQVFPYPKHHSNLKPKLMFHTMQHLLYETSSLQKNIMIISKQ